MKKPSNSYTIQRFGDWFLSGASGLLLTAGFPRTDWSLLSWLALAPLLVSVRHKSLKDAFRLGYWCGLIHYLTTLYWIYYVVQHYGGVPPLAAGGILLLLTGYLACYPAVFASIAVYWKRNPTLWVWGLPCAWVALEWVRAHLITGFPWASLGYTQSAVAQLRQTADIWGVYGVSWLVAFASVCIASQIYRFRAIGALVFWMFCLVCSWFYGNWRVTEIHHLEAKGKPLTVALVQGNVDQAQKWDSDYQEATLKIYGELSREALSESPPPRLLVWPETAMPFFYGLEPKLTQQLDRLIQRLHVPVIFGSPAVTLVGGQPKLQNKAFLVSSSGVVLDDYAKRHLVPFGEYVPLEKLLFFVHKLVQAAGDFVPGNESTPFVLGARKLGILICYEAIFPSLARDERRQGANVLVNITNDAWFGNSSAPFQHLQMARWRAVENRVPLIRCANTGISAAFDSTGDMIGHIPLNERGFLNCSIRNADHFSFYARHGDLFAWICCLTTLAGVLFYAARRKRPKD